MMYYFFSSIRKLNLEVFLEVLEAMDDLLVQMKDFGIKIDDVKLDRYTLVHSRFETDQNEDLAPFHQVISK